MDNIETIRIWLESLVLGLVQNPDDVKLTATRDDQGVLYTLKVNDSDNGSIIGRKGRSIGSIRNLLTTKGMKHRVRASLRIDAPEVDKSNSSNLEGNEK